MTRCAPGRFDVVLLNKSNNVPRCIIEVKRGLKIIDDAKRIIAMAALESGRPRWRHGYLVTILRRSKSEAERLVEELSKEIQSLRAGASAALPKHQEVKVVSALRQIGASRINADSEQIYGVVFHVALVDRLADETTHGLEVSPPRRCSVPNADRAVIHRLQNSISGIDGKRLPSTSPFFVSEACPKALLSD